MVSNNKTPQTDLKNGDDVLMCIPASLVEDELRGILILSRTSSFLCLPLCQLHPPKRLPTTARATDLLLITFRDSEHPHEGCVYLRL
jgi:hypothetical protein